MRILKLIGGIGALAVAVLFYAPLLVLSGIELLPVFNDGNRHYEVLHPTLIVGGFRLSGGLMWMVAIGFALVGTTLVVVSFFLFRRRKAVPCDTAHTLGT